MGVWVDTDFGFDDLWALLLLQAQEVSVDGVSLGAGNAALDQVVQNALAARSVLDVDWQLSVGAATPLVRAPETAERILGPRGMVSRGQFLPIAPQEDLPLFLPKITHWLARDLDRHAVLALGPLTNLATLHSTSPEAFAKISRITWMGGSAGRGNHSAHAEFNALADPEAAAQVFASGVPVDVVDLNACRQVTFAERDMPEGMPALLADLLGGFLDIALSRGRDCMAIYDPLAALALARPDSMTFAPVQVAVDLSGGETYGKTTFSAALDDNAPVRLAMHPVADAAKQCLAAFAPSTLSTLIRKPSDA